MLTTTPHEIEEKNLQIIVYESVRQYCSSHSALWVPSKRIVLLFWSPRSGQPFIFWVVQSRAMRSPLDLHPAVPLLLQLHCRRANCQLTHRSQIDLSCRSLRFEPDTSHTTFPHKPRTAVATGAARRKCERGLLQTCISSCSSIDHFLFVMLSVRKGPPGCYVTPRQAKESGEPTPLGLPVPFHDLHQGLCI